MEPNMPLEEAEAEAEAETKAEADTDAEYDAEDDADATGACMPYTTISDSPTFVVELETLVIVNSRLETVLALRGTATPLPLFRRLPNCTVLWSENLIVPPRI